jgi:alginate O-acetyltransferase complex protein AlgI
MASAVFYMWAVPKYILVILLTIIVDYVAGIIIEKSDQSLKKMWLVISIISTCLILFFFKYFDFFNQILSQFAGIFGVNYESTKLGLELPIGLSFHTFQSLAYVVEVYRGNIKAEKNFFNYALYVLFFPQLVAGPIERPQNLVSQFREKHNFKNENFIAGMKLIIYGIIKKCVVADRLSEYVNTVYGSPYGQSSFNLIIGTIFFAVQIYCDFSGYSDIALGSAKVLGFDLMKNFNKPYFASSFSDFWKRWHISLSTWFRDYVYIPIGGSQKGPVRTQFNLLFTFLISGLWHGANWTFVVWGGLNGAFLVVENLLNPSKKFGIFRCMLVCFGVTIAWVFFRASNISDAIYIIGKIFSPITFDIAIGQEIVIGLILISIFFINEYYSLYFKIDEYLMKKSPLLNSIFFYFMLIGILAAGKFTKTQFIYFQF